MKKIKKNVEASSNPMMKIGRLTKGHKSEEVCCIQEHLVRFGYLENELYLRGELCESTCSALEKYRYFFSLPKVADFDEHIRDHMMISRCGLPDPVSSGIAFTTGCAWQNRSVVTYAFNNGTSDIEGNAEFDAVRNAFRSWETCIPLTFREVQLTQSPDIVIDWRNAKGGNEDGLLSCYNSLF